MPRSIYDAISGANVSSSVFTTLRSTNTTSFVTAHLFRFQCMNFWHFNPYGDYVDFTFTDADFPIFINKYQIAPTNIAQLGPYSGGNLNPIGLTFTPENIELDKLEYGIGFEDKPVKVVWRYNKAVSYTGSTISPFTDAVSPTNLTMQQAMLLGGFQEVPFWIHSALFTDFPDKGGTFLGTALMFRGYLRNIESTKDGLELDIASLMDIFQQVKVPTQIITPNDRSGPYIPLIPVLPGAVVDSITILSPVTVQLNSNFGTYSGSYNQYKDNYVAFQPFSATDNPLDFLPKPFSPPPPFWRISGNEAALGGTLILHFYTPPVVPSGSPIGGFFGQTLLSGGGLGKDGFPFVPSPEVLFT